jgi:hypothetical protein
MAAAVVPSVAPLKIIADVECPTHNKQGYSCVRRRISFGAHRDTIQSNRFLLPAAPFLHAIVPTRISKWHTRRHGGISPQIPRVDS